jgi:hypothetical protein
LKQKAKQIEMQKSEVQKEVAQELDVVQRLEKKKESLPEHIVTKSVITEVQPVTTVSKSTIQGGPQVTPIMKESFASKQLAQTQRLGPAEHLESSSSTSSTSSVMKQDPSFRGSSVSAFGAPSSSTNLAPPSDNRGTASNLAQKLKETFFGSSAGSDSTLHHDELPPAPVAGDKTGLGSTAKSMVKEEFSKAVGNNRNVVSGRDTDLNVASERLVPFSFRILVIDSSSFLVPIDIVVVTDPLDVKSSNPEFEAGTCVVLLSSSSTCESNHFKKHSRVTGTTAQLVVCKKNIYLFLISI